MTGPLQMKEVLTADRGSLGSGHLGSHEPGHRDAQVQVIETVRVPITELLAPVPQLMVRVTFPAGNVSFTGAAGVGEPELQDTDSVVVQEVRPPPGRPAMDKVACPMEPDAWLRTARSRVTVRTGPSPVAKAKDAEVQRGLAGGLLCTPQQQAID